jgi:hypothetical protein
MTTEILPTRVEEFIKQMMPWAHGHQIKAITKFVLAIIDHQQFETARRTDGQRVRLSVLLRRGTPRRQPDIRLPTIFEIETARPQNCFFMRIVLE